MAAPKGTPLDIIGTLNREVNAASPDIKARYKIGYTLFTGSAAEFGKFIAADTEKRGKVIRAANVKTARCQRRFLIRRAALCFVTRRRLRRPSRALSPQTD
jgi:hypothetical protein